MIKTIDDLLKEHTNLYAAVSILIRSAKSNNDHEALRAWDKARRNDVVRQKREAEHPLYFIDLDEAIDKGAKSFRMGKNQWNQFKFLIYFATGENLQPTEYDGVPIERTEDESLFEYTIGP